MRRASTSRSRRASVSIPLIVVLAAFQIVVAAMMLSGVRGSDILARRIETARAFYAAEAGANMAVREVMRGVDEDADGKIGGISDDSNTATDPALGAARIVAESVSAGGTSTITVTGRSGLAARRISLSVETE